MERPAVHHVLDLDRDSVWAGLSKMARRAIRRAEKEEVTVEACHGQAAVLGFYRLHKGWVDHRASTRGIPPALARSMGPTNEPPPAAHTPLRTGEGVPVWLARHDGVVIAAMITLVHGDAALAWRAASDRERADRVRARDWVHRHAIEHALLAGCRYCNRGEPGGMESLMRFKTRFGATPREFAAYRFERLPLSSVTGPAAALRHRSRSGSRVG